MKLPPDRPPDEAGLRHILQELTAVERWAERVGSGDHPDPFVSDEPLEGPEFSVETMTHNGMHRVVGIAAARRSRGPAPLAHHDQPAEEDRAALRSLVRSLLDLAGHESGPARTGVVLTSDGPRVVACHIMQEPLVSDRSRSGSPAR